MKLRENAAVSEFLRTVQTCVGEVWFITDEGDQLNLKSVLSEYLFLSAAISSNLIAHGHIQLEKAEDQAVIQCFLED